MQPKFVIPALLLMSIVFPVGNIRKRSATSFII